MEDIMKSILQPSWWVSVIIASFLVNLLSAYAKPVIDNLMARYSSKRRQEKALKDKERENLISEITMDRSRIIELKIDSLDMKLLGLEFLLMLIAISVVLQELIVTSK